MSPHIPIILFAFNRPTTLLQTLECLNRNQVPLIYAFCDGPRDPRDSAKVREVRDIIRAIDWCRTVITERNENMGLGVSIRAGVTEVLRKHESAIIFEDDLICVDGCYEYLSAALDYYANDRKVMSVTGWTHPLVIPDNVLDQPYFDGRSESLAWGTWSRAWCGMDLDALGLIKKCKKKSIDEYSYGADLVAQAHAEVRRNIWAVRFIYWHILNGGLCLRPPWSMVEHIGVGGDGTNVTTDDGIWQNRPLNNGPPIPVKWPEVVVNEQCSEIWQKNCGFKPRLAVRAYLKSRWFAGRVLKYLGLKK